MLVLFIIHQDSRPQLLLKALRQSPTIMQTPLLNFVGQILSAIMWLLLFLLSDNFFVLFFHFIIEMNKQTMQCNTILSNNKLKRKKKKETYYFVLFTLSLYCRNSFILLAWEIIVGIKTNDVRYSGERIERDNKKFRIISPVIEWVMLMGMNSLILVAW